VTQIEMHAVVALLVDLPAHGLLRGQVGTVVAAWVPGVYEVEFDNLDGATYAMAELRTDQLMVLRHEPAKQAA
jgi:Domain of unknown function (DUF4926)